MLRSSQALVVVSMGLASATACKKKKPAGDAELPTVAGNGVTSSEARKLPVFTRLVVKGALEVTVNVGKDAPLELAGDANLFSHVSSKVANSELTLDTDAVLAPAQRFHLTVGAARLDAVTAVVAAKVTAHGVSSDAVSVRTAGGAHVTADGSAIELTVAARAASRVELTAFTAARVRASVADFANVELGYVEKLDATQRNFGMITYRGTPELTPHVERPASVAPRP